MDHLFDHEKLEVYQISIEFQCLALELLNAVPKRLSIHDQLDRASTSIPLNIAEGNGKYTPKDRCRFLDIARGSALECAACLDVLAAKELIPGSECKAAKIILHRIVSMIIGLIRSVSNERTV